MRGEPILAVMARDGVYRSQFETGTSNGGLTAHPGGDRWRWESRIFGGAYDDAEPALRPKYGALDLHRRAYGAAPRFGSAHVRLAAHTLERTTFCFPDSVFEPEHFGTATAFALASLADAADHDLLDDYVEAHVHGVVDLARDVEALVLDPGYRGTDVEADALRPRRARRVAPGLPPRRRDPARPPGLPRAGASSPSASRSPSDGVVTPQAHRRRRHARAGTTSRPSSGSGTTSRASAPHRPDATCRRSECPARPGRPERQRCLRERVGALPMRGRWALDSLGVTTVVTTVVTAGARRRREAEPARRVDRRERPQRLTVEGAARRTSRRAGRWRRRTRADRRAPCRGSARRAGRPVRPGRRAWPTRDSPRRDAGTSRSSRPSGIRPPTVRSSDRDGDATRQRPGSAATEIGSMRTSSKT